MTTFEEQFPSLENENLLVDYDYLGYSQESIEKFCLDKQRVKEAIEKSKIKVLDDEGKDCGYYIDEDILIKELKELGL